MILGRNTQQWLGLITALAGLIQTIAPVILPGIDPGTLATVLGATTLFLGVLIAFVANTYTTPSNDPQLKAGTMVRVTDQGGTVIDHVAIEPSLGNGAGRPPEG